MPFHLRGARCHLVPGDSPMGLRLPLEAQPFLAKAERTPHYPPDPAQATSPLPTRAARLEQTRRPVRPEPVDPPGAATPRIHG